MIEHQIIAKLIDKLAHIEQQRADHWRELEQIVIEQFFYGEYMPAPNGFCLNPLHAAQERKAETRGLCRTCYSTALKLIKTNQTTWNKLVVEGKATEPKQHQLKDESVRAWLLSA